VPGFEFGEVSLEGGAVVSCESFENSGEGKSEEKTG